MKNGTAAQKWIGWILAGISLAVFALTALPNAQASEDLAMVRMFEPDEAAPLPHVLGMLAEAESLEQSLRNFLHIDGEHHDQDANHAHQRRNHL